ncbi:MAG: PEP-CTERM sorting domain-containing protein [Planctomycetota bacterium]
MPVLRSRSLAALTAALTAVPAFLAHATGPEVPLAFENFDYSEDAYVGPQFAFGTYASYSTLNLGDASQNINAIFPLTGNIVDPTIIPDINAFGGGTPVPFNFKTAADLFGTDPVPDNLNTFEIGNTIQGSGDADGFVEFALKQQGFGDLSDGPANADFLLGENYSQAPFSVWTAPGFDGPVLADFTFTLDSTAGLFDDGGDLSQGFQAQLLDLTDPNNPALMNEITGFYVVDPDENFGDVSVDDDDMTDLLMFNSNPELTGFQDINLTYTLEAELTPGNIYAINLFSDFAANTLGPGADGGSAIIDSDDTVTATLTVQDFTNVRITLPVPEPAAATLLALGSFALLRRR